VAVVALKDVSLSFPILHMGHRSLKKALVATATGGAIMREARAAPVVQALSGISTYFSSGDRIGLVGANGAGKSTLLRIIAGIYEPTEGRIQTEGTIVPLLDIGVGLNPDLTGRENIRLRGMYLGFKPSEFTALANEIEGFTDLGSYLDLPVRTYSSGMQMRLTLAVATAVQPDILLMDEWILAGDSSFLEKARKRMQDFVARASILVIASHSEDIIKTWCTKAMFLKKGRIEAFGPVDSVIAQYNRDAGV
jgi:ABC-type polysaccharide/polyol phosphate transport system ATPase subunit